MGQDTAITRMIADRVNNRGQTLAAISRSTGIPAAYLARLAMAAGIRYRNRRASAEHVARVIRLVDDYGMTIRDAAAACGISKTAAHRYVAAHRRNGTAGEEGIQFHSRRPRRCPVHGVITTWPCVACAAEAARNSAGS